MPLSIERNDLAHMNVDAVVVAANEKLRITGGVGHDVAMAAGFERVQQACDEIGFCPTGSAVATPGFDLHAATIVHAVGPVWHGGDQGEDGVLHETYANALRCCAEAGAQSVALPLISAGSYGFPSEVSFRIAIEEVRSFLEESDADIHLVLFNRSAVRAAMSSFGEIAEYIDDHYVDERATERYSRYEFEPRFSQLDGQFTSQPLEEGAVEYDFESTVFPDEAELGEEASFSAPAASYGAPTPSYVAPAEQYDVRAASYGAPAASGAGVPQDAARMGPPTPPAEHRHARKTQGPLSRISQLIEELRERKSDAHYREEEPVADYSASVPPYGWEAMGSASSPAQEYMPSAPSSNLGDWLEALDEPFSTTLLALIDDRGLTDVQVYKRANMSRQLFSKIRSDANYRPTKKTVLALAIALGLNLDETADLLKRAGFALSNSSKADVIVEYFIVHDIHDIFAINEALYAFDQPTL